MKPAIHPDYHPVVFRDAVTGDEFLTRSTATSAETVVWSDGATYPLIVVEVSNRSHPFWTGTARLFDNEGRVEKFRRKYGLSRETTTGRTEETA